MTRSSGSSSGSSPDRDPVPQLDPYKVWLGCCDELGRLLPKLRGRAVEIRCPKTHLLAYSIETPVGDIFVRRSPWVERDGDRGWEVGWASEDGIQVAQCSCGRQYRLDPSRIDRGRRQMGSDEIGVPPVATDGPLLPQSNPFA